MPAPTKQRFKNIKAVFHGASEHNTVKEISVEENTNEITDSGDNDTEDTFIEKGKTSLRGTMTIADPIQAEALKGAAKAALTWEGEGATGAVDAEFSVTDVVFLNRSQSCMHDGVHMTRLSFRGKKLTVAAAA